MGNKAKVTINPYREQLVTVYLDQDLPYWLEDVLTGASRSQGTTRLSARMLLNFLTVYDQFTTESILTYLNRKREVLGEPVVSTSYARTIRRALECALAAIEHQLTQCGKSWVGNQYRNGDIAMMLAAFGKTKR